MDFEKVYRLGETFTRGALRAKSVSVLTDDGWAMALGEMVPEPPLVLKQNMGTTPRDLVGTGYVATKLLSSRAIDLLRTCGFTGWSTYPVELRDKKDKAIPGYHGFAVTGRCGPIDNTKSQRVLKLIPTHPDGQMPVWVGLYFDPATWDGTDIFMPKGTVHIFVVEKVKEAFEKAKITNIRFKRLTEIERLKTEVESTKP